MPLVASKVATRLMVGAMPVSCRAKLTVTTSPGSATPLVGRQPSATREAPAGITTATGLASEPATLVTPVFSGSSQSRKRSPDELPLAQASESFP